jgi:hypothetical protein
MISPFLMTLINPRSHLALTPPAPHSPDRSTANIATTSHIQTQYHPKSGRPTKIHRIDDPSHAPLPSTYQPDPEPWSPFFATHEDFLVSEILLEGSLGKDLSDRLLKIFKLVHAGTGRVTLSTFSEVQTAWDHASVQLTPVSPRVMSRRRAHRLS